MKKRIALLLALTLSLSILLASCGSGKYLGFEGVFNGNVETEEDEELLYGKAELNSALTDMELDYYSSYYGTLLLFENWNAEAGENKAVVLNTKTGDVVFQLAQEEDGAKITKDVSVNSDLYDFNYIYVIERDASNENSVSYEHTIYTALGEKVASKKSASTARMRVTQICYTADDEGILCLIDDKVYEIKDDVATYRFDKGLSSFSSGYDVVTEKNFYDLSSGELKVYDAQFKLVAYWSVPAGCEVESGCLVLADGNVLLQYFKLLPFDADDYDVYVDGTKCEFHTVLFDIAKGSAKEIDLDYEVEYVFNAAVAPSFFADYIVDDSIENVVSLYPIVDKAIDENDVKVAVFDNKMKLKGFLGQEIANQEGTAEPIGNNRFIVRNKAYQEFLINEKGEVIGDVSDAYYDSALGYFVMDEKYYDLDLKLVFDEGDISYHYLDEGNEYTLYYEEDEEGNKTYYIRNGVTVSALSLPKNAYGIFAYDNYFEYKYIDEATEYGEQDQYYTVYCNAKGEKIYSVQTNKETYRNHDVYSYGSILLIKLYSVDEGEGTTRYYIAK